MKTRIGGTIESNSKRILKRAAIIRNSVEGQLEVLDEKTKELRDLVGSGQADAN